MPQRNIVKVKFSDLELAFDFKSFDSYGDHEAYLCIESGKIYYSSDLIDDEEELPADIYDNDKYIEIPSKQDMDLGKSLVFGFIDKYLPAEYELVSSMFRKKGAYSRFKSFLEVKGLLDKWHNYEKEAQIRAIKDWCNENNIEYSI